MKHLVLPLALAAFALAASATAQTKEEPKADPKAGTETTAQKEKMSCCADMGGAGAKECADKDCCKAGGHDKAAMEKMHGKMTDKEMKEMMEKHGKMDSKEMKAMHEKMMKEMDGKDGDAARDAKADDKKDDDKDEDDDLL